MPLVVDCTAALTPLSDSVIYIAISFLEWRVASAVANVFLTLPQAALINQKTFLQHF